MATYQSVEGEIEIHVFEFHDTAPIMLRVQVPTSPLIRIKELARQHNNPKLNQWQRVRYANGEEVSEYAKRHPQLQMKDTRFNGK